AARAARPAAAGAAQQAVEALAGTLAQSGAGSAWVAGLSVRAASLAETTMKALLLGKLQVTAVALLGVGLLGPVLEYATHTPANVPEPAVVMVDRPEGMGPPAAA